MRSGSADVVGCWPPRRSVRLDHPVVMGILNVTPDSFSDGGEHASVAAAVARAEAMAREGAEVIDIGGESTRPGAARVDAAEQVQRVVPVIEAIRGSSGAAADVAISVDTTLSRVAEAALQAGADAINDVSAGTEDAEILALAAASRAGLVLMHRLRAPGEDSYSDAYREAPVYDDVVASVRDFLEDAIARAARAGVARDAIVGDPGLGFGKTVAQNLELISRTGEFASLGVPILSGLSRKSFVGRAGMREGDGDPPAAGDRLGATIGLSVTHLLAGASIFRVHDVAEHVRALSACRRAVPSVRDRIESRPSGRTE